MLPDDFEWRYDALKVNGHLVARLSWQLGGRYLVELHVDREGHRTHDGPGRDDAVRYTEAWARKWEAEIRAAYPPDRRAHTAGDPAS